MSGALEIADPIRRALGITIQVLEETELPPHSDIAHMRPTRRQRVSFDKGTAMPKTIESISSATASAFNLRSIADTVGGQVIGSNVRVVWPGKDASKIGGIAISLANNHHGIIVNSFHHDVAPSEAFAYVKSILNGRTIVPCTDPFDRADKITLALTQWGEGVDPRGTIAEQYLNRWRKLTLPPEVAGSVLRWNESIGALIGLFHEFHTDRPTGVTRIFISPEGRLIDRRFLGAIKGGAIKLSPPKNGVLCIAEGVETAMAAQQLGIGPAWALGCAGAVSAFPCLPYVSTLIISAEKDTPWRDNDASREAVEECAERWSSSGHDVRIIRPNGKGDLNDTLRFKGKFTINTFITSRFYETAH
jgi:hypothetical protein